MSSIPQMATTLQTILGPDLEPIGRQSGVIQRLRKFSAEILLKRLVFTLLKTPTPKTKDYVASADQLGLPLTERAVEKRFPPKLVIFLRGVLERVLPQAVAATPVATPLLPRQVRSASDLEPHAGRSGWYLAHLSCRGNTGTSPFGPARREMSRPLSFFQAQFTRLLPPLKGGGFRR